LFLEDHHGVLGIENVDLAPDGHQEEAVGVPVDYVEELVDHNSFAVEPIFELQRELSFLLQ